MYNTVLINKKIIKSKEFAEVTVHVFVLHLHMVCTFKSAHEYGKVEEPYR